MVSKSGISVAGFVASHLYTASLSVTLARIVSSADIDLSWFVLMTEGICTKEKQNDTSIEVITETIRKKSIHQFFEQLDNSFLNKQHRIWREDRVANSPP